MAMSNDCSHADATSAMQPVVQHSTELVVFFSNTDVGKLGIIFADEW